MAKKSQSLFQVSTLWLVWVVWVGWVGWLGLIGLRHWIGELYPIWVKSEAQSHRNLIRNLKKTEGNFQDDPSTEMYRDVQRCTEPKSKRGWVFHVRRQNFDHIDDASRSLQCLQILQLVAQTQTQGQAMASALTPLPSKASSEHETKTRPTIKD